MNKKLFVVLVSIMFVLPMFVSANPFWDLITGHATYRSKPTVNIVTSSLSYGQQTIKATIYDKDGDLSSAYISMKPSSSWRYRVYNKVMKCRGDGYKKECTYSVKIDKSWGSSIRIYVKGRDRYGYGKNVYKLVKVYPNVDPTPVPVTSCKDSDGGKVYNVKGTVKDKYGRSYTDSCYSTTGLKEYYCSNGYARYAYHKCTKCVNGACLEIPSPINSHMVCKGTSCVKVAGEGTNQCKTNAECGVVTSCRDSDGGKVYNVKGTVKDKYGRSNTDYCYSPTGLKEYYCSGDYVGYEYHKCTKCVNGACLNTSVPTPVPVTSCKDSDGGKVYNVKGTVKDKYGRSYTDSCYSTTGLKEYYCSNGYARYVYHKCTKCVNGACLNTSVPTPVPVTSCKDSDGGKVYNVKGTVKDKYGRSYTDSCYSTTGLKEYYCSRDYVRYEYHKCSKCLNGACLEIPSPINSHMVCKGTSCVKVAGKGTNQCKTNAECGVVTSCADSDGGKVYNVKGTVKDKYGRSNTDYCYSPTGLKEYYCSRDYVRYEYHKCSKCLNGACLNSSNCVGEGQVGRFGAKCCSNLKKIPHSNLVNGVCLQPRDGSFVCSNCGNGKCEQWENTCNCPVDCKETPKCVGEGGSIPVIQNPPSCCAGLKLIKPISSNLVGSIGICTAKCGDGICNSKIESNYNCPIDCKNPLSSCKDTDGGKNIYVKGSVDYQNGNAVSHVTDYCSGSSLVEYYCSQNNVAKTTNYCRSGCYNGACKTLNSECKVGEWKCDDNWPKYAYACNNGKWLNIGTPPPPPPNGKWVCDKNGHLGIARLISNPSSSVPTEGGYCNYNNNPWKCSNTIWPGNAYFCVNNKWLKIEIPPAPPNSQYKCEDGNVKIIAQ